MRNRTSIVALAALLLLSLRPAHAIEPSIVTLDAGARAQGNRKDVAERVGDRIFKTEWPAQVLKVAANGADGVVVVGLRVSGVKFHHPLTQAQFSSEIASLVTETFKSDPAISEVDIWASVPLDVTKDVVVTGDLAKPTSKTVFTASVLRNEPQAALDARLRSGNGVFWDQDWARTLSNQKV